MSATEIADFVTPDAVEAVYRRSLELRTLSTPERHRLFAQTQRALAARDPKLLMLLDRGASIMAKMAEDQYGETNRSATDYALRVPPTEFQIWREAFVTLDRGDPAPNFIELYTAAGMLAGVVQ